MKSVVMIAYAFPPEGAAGSYRPLRFARQLQKFGWNVAVICADKIAYERYDPELILSVPREIKVVRVKHHDPWQVFQAKRAKNIERKLHTRASFATARAHDIQQSKLRSFLSRMIRRAEGWYYYPDTAKTWIMPAVRETVRLCRSERPMVLWATGQPWSSFIVAQRASQTTGVPYVMDFRGLWTVVPNASAKIRPAWARWLDRRILASLFENSRAAVFFSEVEAECMLRAYKNVLSPDKIHIIPNGFDGNVDNFQSPAGDKCVILYTGTLADHRYDTLLEALLQLKKSNPTLANRLSLRFVTDNRDELTKQVTSLGLTHVIQVSAPTTYAEITQLEKQAHAFLMLGLTSTITGHETIVGSKLFGYMKTGKPIIGVLAEGETKRILRDIGVATIADVAIPGEIADLLRRLLETWSIGNLRSLAPEPSACAVYASDSQTRALLRALDGTIPAIPFIPGSMEVPISLRSSIGYDTNISVTEFMNSKIPTTRS